MTTDASERWDETVDVVVVGSGGGITGAYTAAREGLSVALVEASDKFGGTTAFSGGGGMWFPCNPVLRRLGVDDTIADARTYFHAVVGDRTPRDLQDAYVEGGARLVEYLQGPDVDWWMADWDDQLICKVNRPELADLAGRSIGEIARERGQAPMDTALDLVLEDGQFWIAPTIKSQDHLDRLIASPLCVPIGDGFAHHPERHRAYGIMPKSFGTFPLVLGSYVRDRGVLSPEEFNQQKAKVLG